MSDNERNESPMPSSRILNRSDTTEGFASRDKGLAGSESESGIRSGVASGSGRAPLCGESATNPATSARQLTDTPVSHAKNGLQILSLVRGRRIPLREATYTIVDRAQGGDAVLRLYGERAYLISEAELKAVEDRIMAAIAQLEADRAARREILQTAGLADQLKEMERTNGELRDQSDGFHDVAAAGVDR